MVQNVLMLGLVSSFIALATAADASEAEDKNLLQGQPFLQGVKPSMAGRTMLIAENASEIKPGPMQEDRTALLQKIEKAKEQGVGIGNYVSAFKAIDDSIGPTTQDSDIKPRVESLSRAIDEQLERSAKLKLQRPAPGYSTGNNWSGTSSGRASFPASSNGSFNMNSLSGRLPAGITQSDVKKFTGGGDIDFDKAIKQMNDNPETKKILERIRSQK
jgi:hypothetical protein